MGPHLTRIRSGRLTAFTALSLTTAAAAAALALGSCSAPQPTSAATPPATLSATDFWSSTSSPGNEVDPAQSLADLESRSEQIVLGRVVAAQSGPDHPLTVGGATVDLDGTTVVTVQVSQSLTGPPTDQVQVWLHGERAQLNGVPADRLPEDQHLWFLIPSEHPGLTLPTTQAGVIGPDHTADPTTLLDPAQAPEIVPSGAQSVQDVAAEMEEAASTR